MKFLQFLFDGGSVFAEELDFIVEFSEFVENFVFVFEVHFAEVDDLVAAVLG